MKLIQLKNNDIQEKCMLPKNIFLTTLLFVITTPTFAFFCPTNFNEIKNGDTIDQVKIQCGKPTAESESTSKINMPQEWNYYVQMSPTDQATLKTTIAFTKGKATNMSVNGIGVSSTAICAGNNISVGDTQESITRACGKPAFINQGNQSNAAAIKVVELTYVGTSTAILVFENGILTETK
jgi:hypothetical protein